MDQTSEKNQSLWRLAASPVIWSIHFLLCYITASIWCSKAANPSEDFWILQSVIVGYTLVALISIGLLGWAGYRRHSLGGEDLPHDDDTPEDRHRFLGFATLLLSALSGVAVLYASFVAIFFRNCN